MARPGLGSRCGRLREENHDLDRTKITDAGLGLLASLDQLQHISLNWTAVTDDGVRKLEPLKLLQSLNLRETKVTWSGTSGLKRTNPGFTTMY